MKKHIIIFTAMIVALLTITSCKKDFINETVESNFTPYTLRDSLSFEAAITGMQTQYGLWHSITQAIAGGGQGWLAVWQAGTDVAFNKSRNDLDQWTVPYINYEKLSSTDPAALF